MKISSLLLLFFAIFASGAINANTTNAGNEVDADLDPVIEYLLNGGVLTHSNEENTDEELIMSGIWRCGNCTDIDDSRIVYSEEYFCEDDDEIDGSMQLEFILEGMRCVTVSSVKSGVVQRLTGACNGAVTLHVKPSRRFVVHVYV